MNKDYFVTTTLSIEYNEKNIKKVIDKASNLGFIFYDFIPGERYEDSPTIDSNQAFKNVLTKSKFDDGLFIELTKGYFTLLWFYKDDEGRLEYSLGAFYNIKDKTIENFYTQIDFKYYIEIALSLGEDFGIEKLTADYID